MIKPKEELFSTQKSVFYYISHYRERDPVLGSYPDYFDDIYAERLIENVSQGIMPLGGRTKRNDFKVIIVPQDKRTQDLIADGIAQDDYRKDLAGQLCAFFEDCAQSIMAFGEADYEIAYLSRQNDDKVVGFKLVLIPPFSLTRDTEKLYQYLPKELADLLKLPQYIQLSECDILRFQAPENFQDEIKYILTALASLSKNPTHPDFVLGNMNDNSVRIPFNIEEFRYSQHLALVDAGKQIGWNPFTPDNNLLEYYWFHRFLLFEQFKINLRDNIISTFNEGLNIIGQRLGFSARLEIKGLPTNEDANFALSELSAGNLSFNELLDRFSLL